MDASTGDKKIEFVNNVLETIVSHCVTTADKIYYLGYAIKCLLETSLVGVMMIVIHILINNDTPEYLTIYFCNYFNKVVKDMTKQVIREINNGSWKSNNDYENIINSTNLYKIIKGTTIENGIKRALATGDFGIKSVNLQKLV